jgi:hypothetical protein
MATHFTNGAHGDVPGERCKDNNLPVASGHQQNILSPGFSIALSGACTSSIHVVNYDPDFIKEQLSSYHEPSRFFCYI